MAYFQFRREQILPSSTEEIWAFITNPGNLKRITPDSMGFDITSESLPEMMYEGMIIAYRVAPLLGIPTTWVTEITHIKKNHYFVDEQRVGPYKMWHHEHLLEASKDGVKMTDIVSYQPPLGFLGSIANHLIIRRKLYQIFDHREAVLKSLFNHS